MRPSKEFITPKTMKIMENVVMKEEYMALSQKILMSLGKILKMKTAW
jgi:hypothetical protein